MTDQYQNSGVRRRTLLRNGTIAGVVASGTLMGGVVARSSSGRKQGGRAQLDGEVERNRPFTLTPEGTDTRNASCMAEESANQVYLTYTIQYCDSDDEDGTLYVIPDEAELLPDEVYEIHSTTPCRTNDLTMVSFGPSQEPC